MAQIKTRSTITISGTVPLAHERAFGCGFNTSNQKKTHNLVRQNAEFFANFSLWKAAFEMLKNGIFQSILTHNSALKQTRKPIFQEFNCKNQDCLKTRKTPSQRRFFFGENDECRQLPNLHFAHGCCIIDSVISS